MNSTAHHNQDNTNNAAFPRTPKAHQKAVGGKFGEVELDDAISSFESVDDFVKGANKRHFYVVEANKHVSIYQGSFRVQDLTNALRRGAECVSYCVASRSNDDVASDFMHQFDYSLSKAWAFLEAQEYPERGGVQWEGLTIYRETTPGVRCWSPFPVALAQLKPLKEVPKKWTLSHLYRLIVNGQYRDLRCDGYYTDDYAYDAASNYGKDRITNGLSFVSKIIGSPSGWRVYQSGDRLNINCYSFDSNSLIIDLDNSPKPPKVEHEETTQAEAVESEPAEQAQESVPEAETADQGAPSLESLGLEVIESMTTPTRPGKKPRPVWEVSGKVEQCADILREAGGRKWRGKYSFWEDPTEAILEAAQEVKPLTYAEQVERKLERTERRAERFGVYAENAEKRSDAACNRSRQLLDPIPMGQPILVGHHSERGHRATLAKADNAMRRAVEESKKARHFQNRAEGAEYRLKQVNHPSYINNQIEKAQSEIRAITRRLEGLQLGSNAPEADREYKTHLLARLDEETEKRDYWKNRLDTLGVHIYTKSEISKGDRLKYRGTWYPVRRVNNKTVTVGNWLGVDSFTWHVPYAEIQAVEKAND